MRALIVLLIFCFVVYAQDQSWKLYEDSQVAIIEITTSSEAVNFMYAFPESDSLHMASVHFQNAWIDETVDSVAIRIRGNTSRVSQKKSFKLDFEHFVNGREFYNVDKMNLNGEHNDPSIMRAKLAWDFFKQAGIIVSRAAHCAVYINGEFYGLYISVEHYDREFIKKNFADGSGNLYKCLYPADLVDHSDDPENYPGYPKHTPIWDNSRRVYDLKTNEDLDDYSKLTRFINIVNNTSDSRFSDSLESVLNVPAAIKLMAMDVLLGSWDDYWANMNNFYLYHEPTVDKFYMIPYDYDNIMGIDWFDIDWDTADPYNWPRLNWDFRPLVERILANAEYHNLYTHFLNFYSNNIFDLPLWDSRLDSLKNMIEPYASQDTFRTFDYGYTDEDFDQSYSYDYNRDHVKRGLRQYVSNRNSSLPEKLFYKDANPVVYDFNYYPLQPSDKDTIYFEIAAFSPNSLTTVELQYQRSDNETVLIKPFTYLPVQGSKKIEETDRWVAKIGPLPQGVSLKYIIFIKNDANRFTVYPHKERSLAVARNGDEGVVINEFLASNATINSDENGQFEDWLELYNTALDTIDLSGYYLTDKDTNLTKWRIPDGTKIEPAGFLLFWCDEDQSQGPLHTNFKISAAGEFLALVSPDGNIVYDSLTFSAQVTDISYGRNPDGGENWEFALPTPGITNVVTGLDDKQIFPTKFDMMAFPNPFNSTLNIQFKLPKAADVTIHLFDVLGREVWKKKLFNQNPGTHSIKWKGTSDSGNTSGSGLFFLKVSTADFQKTQKVLLIK